MTRRNRNASSPRSALCRWLLGVLFCLGLFALSSLLLSMVVYATPDPAKLVAPAALGAHMLSGLIGGFVICRRQETGGFLFALLTTLFFALLLVLCGVILTKGQLPAAALMNHLCFFLTALLGAFLGRRRRGKRRHARA